jgi:hypothetical protein
MEIDIHDASPRPDSLNGTTYTPTASIALVITRQDKLDDLALKELKQPWFWRLT